MANELARMMKNKRDAELRLQNQNQKPVVIENTDGSYYAPEQSDYTAQLAQGKNIIITTSGNIKTIAAVMNLLEGSNISVSAPDENGAVTITGTISQATESVIGGIKAKAKTTEGAEIAIDTTTGKLYGPSASWPDYMAQDTDGVKIYDSSAKTNLIATLGRIIDASLSTETSHIPDMTSNTAPSGTASASTTFTGYDAFKAMDQDSATYWSTATATPTGWIAYEWAAAKKINKYTIKGRADASDGSPKNWTFEGWNGSAWVVLDTRSNITWTNGEKKTFTCSNETSYTKYRINVTANNGRATLNIAEIEMVEVSAGGYIYGVITDRYMKKLSGAALPTASVDYRGQVFTFLGGAGVADVAYICIKNASDAYIWQAI